jgi:hypothetical protein
MVTDRALGLSFTTGPSAPDGTYGSAGADYGEIGWTYGQSLTDPTETGYELTAYPGWGPRVPDWEYRQWDTSPALEISLLAPGAVPIDYSLVDTAELILTRTSYGAFEYQPAFALTVGADRLTRTWEEGDLLVAGHFRVIVKLVFGSGRTMTIPSRDLAALVVRNAERPT